MKALVLAGGSGTRLRPITHTSAKQLVPLANQPIIFYCLEAIAEAGIRDVGVVVGSTADEIRATVGDGSRWGLSVTYLPQEAPLGLAHCVIIGRDFLGDEPFVMYLGDNYLSGGIEKFVCEFEADRPNALVLLTQVEHPENFGVAEVDAGGRIARLVEKPADPKSDLALVGVYMFDAHIHEAVRAIKPSDRGELEITDAIQWLIDADRVVRSHEVHGPWIDTGKRQDLLEANRIVLDTIEREIHGSVDAESRVEGRVIVQAGAQIERSIVRGPAIIGHNARIIDAFVGPYSSINDEACVVDSEVEHSIMLEASVVEGIRRVEGSLIGRHVRVARNDDSPRTYRFMLGDHSEVHVL